ncbi:Choline/Carnitine O-acyltransferase, partial [Ostertagia ostertagi]
ASLDNRLWPVRPVYFLAGAASIGAVQDQFDSLKEQAESFLKNEGPRLQLYAWFMSFTTSNYITAFWEKYAYLYSRQPLLINSSVAHMDFLEVPENRRSTWAYMAARVTYFEGMSQLAVDRQSLKPLGSGLLCSRHYDKLYSVCRVPGEEMDELVNYGIAKHVVAIYNGMFYKVMLCDERNRMYSIEELTKIYAEIFSRNEKVTGAASRVAALTAARRDEWARNREKFFLKNPTNAATLREIESAAFMLTLDDAEYFT